MKRILKRWWWTIFLVPILAIAGFVIWASNPLGPMPEAIAAMQTDELVQVDHSEWIVFQPTGTLATTGVIFYPGGRVDARSYAPAARAIAEQGYLVVITPMPLNLAVFAPDKALEVLQVFPEVTDWIIGGHSLGGSMAANFSYKNPEMIDGLYFWASYPASSDDLSNTTTLEVISIYASNDGLATTEKIQASIPLLPQSTIWTEIAGGNHAQFGWYGDQDGDQPATISRIEQQEQTVDAMLQFLVAIKE